MKESVLGLPFFLFYCNYLLGKSFNRRKSVAWCWPVGKGEYWVCGFWWWFFFFFSFLWYLLVRKQKYLKVLWIVWFCFVNVPNSYAQHLPSEQLACYYRFFAEHIWELICLGGVTGYFICYCLYPWSAPCLPWADTQRLILKCNVWTQSSDVGKKCSNNILEKMGLEG